MSTLVIINPADLVPNPNNPRSVIDEQDPDFLALVKSIQTLGILQPVLVTEGQEGDPISRPYLEGDEEVFDAADGKFWQLEDGHRRTLAALAAGLKEIPAYYEGNRSLTEREINMLAANLHRQDLSPVDEARGYKGLVDGGMKQSEVAAAVGRSPAHVSKRLALLNLPATVQNSIGTTLDIEHAVSLAGLAKQGMDEKAVAKLAKKPADIESAARKQENAVTAAKMVRTLEAEHPKATVELVDRQPYNRVEARVPQDDLFAGFETKHRDQACAILLVVDDGYSAPSVKHLCSDRKRHDKAVTGCPAWPAREAAEVADAPKVDESQLTTEERKAQRDKAKALKAHQAEVDRRRSILTTAREQVTTWARDRVRGTRNDVINLLTEVGSALVSMEADLPEALGVLAHLNVELPDDPGWAAIIPIMSEMPGVDRLRFLALMGADLTFAAAASVNVADPNLADLRDAIAAARSLAGAGCEPIGPVLDLLAELEAPLAEAAAAAEAARLEDALPFKDEEADLIERLAEAEAAQGEDEDDTGL